MLIEQGRVRELDGRPWAGIELVSEARVQEIVLLIVRWAKERGEPFQLLFPVKSRGAGGIELLTPYLWARMNEPRDLFSVGAVKGIVGCVRDDEKVLGVDDSFVQGIIRQAEEAAAGWSHGIRVGSFVRVLYGDCRMLCGMVRRMGKGMVVVEVELRSRRVRITAPVRALEKLARKGEFYG